MKKKILQIRKFHPTGKFYAEYRLSDYGTITQWGDTMEEALEKVKRIVEECCGEKVDQDGTIYDI